MKVCTCCKQEKELSEFCHNKRNLDNRDKRCRKCSGANTARWQKKNPEKVMIATQRWQAANHKQYMAINKRWQKANPEKVAKHNAKWAKTHMEYVLARNAKRRANKLNATPAWANEFFIEEIYDLAKLRTKYTGTKWHVDHIVPLKSKLVCGLHTEANLRVIPALTNIAKGNRVWPDMPGV